MCLQALVLQQPQERRMETFDAYLERKSREISLLNACLNAPLTLSRPGSPAEVIKQKFWLSSALKAEHAIEDWTLTETAWAHPGKVRTGPFEFSYDYQRADLEVQGPSFYAFEQPAWHDTIYTSSGMSAISALLFASAKFLPSADIMVLPGSYGETLELIETHARHLRAVQLTNPVTDLATAADKHRILLLDTSTPSHGIEATMRCPSPRLDLVIFDTTCFSSGSGRIGRVLRWARRHDLPVVLVRSHTKLDSLGVEYGRLGSAVFVGANEPGMTERRGLTRALANETRHAVRLFGGAALPAHFPPYAGNAGYRALADRRVASILRNSRRTARYFAKVLAGAPPPVHFAHGLYLTLVPNRALDEGQARQLAEELSTDLASAGMPLRHAGSFGFDFAATEWFHDTSGDRYLVRIAVPDLPTLLWDEIAKAIADWWAATVLRRGEGPNHSHGIMTEPGSKTCIHRRRGNPLWHQTRKPP